MSALERKNIQIYCVVLFLCSLVFASEECDRILGRWYTEKCQAAFDFYRIGDEYKARLIAIEKPDLTDFLNPVDSLRHRKLDGLTTIYGLLYDSQKRRWYNGKVYNPEDGKTYSCYCSLTKDGKLMFRGYLGVSALGKSQQWTRDRCGNQRNSE